MAWLPITIPWSCFSSNPGNAHIKAAWDKYIADWKRPTKDTQRLACATAELWEWVTVGVYRDGNWAMKEIDRKRTNFEWGTKTLGIILLVTVSSSAVVVTCGLQYPPGWTFAVCINTGRGSIATLLAADILTMILLALLGWSLIPARSSEWLTMGLYAHMIQMRQHVFDDE